MRINRQLKHKLNCLALPCVWHVGSNLYNLQFDKNLKRVWQESESELYSLVANLSI